MRNKSTGPDFGASQPKTAQQAGHEPVRAQAGPTKAGPLRLVRHFVLVNSLAAAAGAAFGQTSAPLPSHRSRVPITVDGESVRLDMRIFKRGGRVLHHPVVGVLVHTFAVTGRR